MIRAYLLGNAACTNIDRPLQLYKLFIEVDSTQVEINPFAVTPGGDVVCFDAKIAFDENASFRQKKLFESADNTEGDAREVAASALGLNYIAMDGNIGWLVRVIPHIRTSPYRVPMLLNFLYA